MDFYLAVEHNSERSILSVIGLSYKTIGILKFEMASCLKIEIENTLINLNLGEYVFYQLVIAWKFICTIR